MVWCVSSPDRISFLLRQPASILRSRNWRVLVIPILGLLAFFVLGIWTVVLDIIFAVRLSTDNEVEQSYYVYEALLTVDLVLNALATGLMIWKLWRAGNRFGSLSAERRRNPYMSIIVAVIESGTLYTVVIGVYTTLWYLEHVCTVRVSFRRSLMDTNQS